MEFRAIIEWQQRLEGLSRQLLENLGNLGRQRELLDALLAPQMVSQPVRESPETYQNE
jgi:hypothetical protein